MDKPRSQPVTRGLVKNCPKLSKFMKPLEKWKLSLRCVYISSSKSSGSQCLSEFSSIDHKDLAELRRSLTGLDPVPECKHYLKT